MPDDDRPRFSIGDAVLATVVAILLGVIGVAIVFTAAGYERAEDASIEATVAAQVFLWAGLIGVPWYVSRRKGSGDLRRDYGLAMRWRDIPVGMASGIATQVAVIVLLPLYDLLGVDPDEVNESAQELGDKADDPLGVVILVLMAVIGAAVTEEVCYRGLWLRALDRRVPTWAAIGISALVFAAVHFQPLAIPPLAIFGVVAGVLATRSGRLGPAIWAHVGFNALAVLGLVLD